MWYRFHSYHIYFYGHILDLHNRILWSADQSSSEVDLDKNSTHVIECDCECRKCDCNRKLTWVESESISNTPFDKYWSDSTHVIFISIITFWTFTIAFSDIDFIHTIFIFTVTFWTFTIAYYEVLINLLPKSILIKIPLMSYSFL